MEPRELCFEDGGQVFSPHQPFARIGADGRHLVKTLTPRIPTFGGTPTNHYPQGSVLLGIVEPAKEAIGNRVQSAYPFLRLTVVSARGVPGDGRERPGSGKRNGE
jgi:hypothetical protein